MLVETLVKFALLGSTWVLYVLLMCSVISFAAMAERWLFFRKNTKAGATLRADLTKAVTADDEAGVRAAILAGTTIEGAVLRDALPFLHGGSSAVLDAVESAFGREKKGLERSMTMLGTLGNNAPFIGLFGTVLGVIEAFSHLGHNDGSAMGGVMSAIADALVATGVGIFVAIPAVVAYNVSQEKIAAIETEVTSLAKLLAAWLTTRERHGRIITVHEGGLRASEPRPSAPARTEIATGGAS